MPPRNPRWLTPQQADLARRAKDNLPALRNQPAEPGALAVPEREARGLPGLDANVEVRS